MATDSPAKLNYTQVPNSKVGSYSLHVRSRYILLFISKMCDQCLRNQSDEALNKAKRDDFADVLY